MSALKELINASTSAVTRKVAISAIVDTDIDWTGTADDVSGIQVCVCNHARTEGSVRAVDVGVERAGKEIRVEMTLMSVPKADTAVSRYAVTLVADICAIVGMDIV